MRKQDMTEEICAKMVDDGVFIFRPMHTEVMVYISCILPYDCVDCEYNSYHCSKVRNNSKMLSKLFPERLL